MNVEDCCGNCRFWDDFPSRNAAGELVPIKGLVAGTVLGQCRRYPPGIPSRSEARGDLNAEFPETYQDAWCGEHQPARESE